MKKIFLSLTSVALIVAISSCNQAPTAMTADQINKKADSTVTVKAKEMTDNAGKECAANMAAAVKAKSDQIMAAAAAKAAATNGK